MASSYALFSAIGAVNNTGTTVINGDIGTNDGAFVGFTTSVITGAIHVVDPTSAQVATDVSTAYTTLTNLTCDSTLPVSLGDGQILHSGIYCIGASSVLTGTLVLDGEGDPNAVFVFKINGALSTGISSHIVTINSASSNNVYWNVTGHLDLGANSVFEGVIISDGGSLNLASGATLIGQGLVVNGAIYVNNSTVGASTLVPLPATLLMFSAIPKENSCQIEWVTADENNLSQFSVERSTNAEEHSWKSIAIIKAAGGSVAKKNYSYTDRYPTAGLNYYRLKITDLSGSYKYSSIVKISIRIAENKILISPNPVTKSLTIKVMDQLQIGSKCTISDVTGKLFRSFILTNINLIEADLWPSGAYFIKFADGSSFKIEKN